MDISLNSHEARIFGVLVEKAFTTPDQYPLSLNATANGSNQKSNRDPVVDFSEAEVRIALQGLRMKGLVGGASSSGSRVEKFRHNGRETLKVDERQLATLAELLLRGPQTAGELRTRAKRMRDIPSLDVMAEVLEQLTERGYVRSLPGGRATRYTQRLCASLHPDGDDAPATAAPTVATRPAPTAEPPPARADLGARVAELESKVASLESKVERLLEELGA